MAVADRRAWLEEAGRGAPGAHKEPQKPCPESICNAHTVTLGFWRGWLLASSIFGVAEEKGGTKKGCKKTEEKIGTCIKKIHVKN